MAAGDVYIRQDGFTYTLAYRDASNVLRETNPRPIVASGALSTLPASPSAGDVVLGHFGSDADDTRVIAYYWGAGWSYGIIAEVLGVKPDGPMRVSGGDLQLQVGGVWKNVDTRAV